MAAAGFNQTPGTVMPSVGQRSFNGSLADDKRLLLLSSRVRNRPAMYAAAFPGVRIVEFPFESATLDEILERIGKTLADCGKVSSIAVALHSSERELFICLSGDARLSRSALIIDPMVKKFLEDLVHRFLDKDDWSARLDFLATYMAEQVEGGLLAKELESILNCQVGLSKNLEGSDIQVTRNQSTGRFLTVGEMYFDLPTLKNHLNQIGKVAKDGKKKLESYEKIRIVGKGAFGHAVLYRRRIDGITCIIKEINMLDLSASDRQMALNEVLVLATLDHPNIIGYHDSFEIDGVLMIEMEYADGGNLAEFLAKRKKRIDERDILDVFSQMVSAIRYMHSRNVLHRDLKTANIFLTKEGMVKIGDFGISKMLTTRQGGAQTVLGTPYYISPEMCEGKIYDEKSDIWALGCIAYEMACLQKTFEGSNLPALVNKIMRGQFAPIRGDYSPLFKQLIRDLLQKDPEFRPTAAEILLQRLPELQAQFDDSRYEMTEGDLEMEELEESTRGKTRQSRPPRSVLYYLKGYESTISLTPVQLPPRTRILQVCVSNTHIVALTSDLMVFTWGEGRRGQLGHGEVESWRSRPQVVEALKTKSITHVGAGDGFSVFTSDNGIVMTCGDGSFGALGHGDWQSSAEPKLVEDILDVDVSAIACGPEHVVVVSGQGDVFSWGKGEGGRLGLDSEEDQCSPQKVKLDAEDIYIVNASCNGNGTIFLSNLGQVYATGGNRYNRLGLDETKVGLFSSHVEKVLVPTRVKSIKNPIVDLSMGPNHTMCVTDGGKIIAMGRNAEAQLGKGHARSVANPEIVKAMQEKEVVMLSCGATFTVAVTTENVIYFWGTRFISPLTRPSTRDAFGQSFGARLATPAETMMTDNEVSMMMARERMASGLAVREGDQTLLHASLDGRTVAATLNSTELLNQQGEITMKDVVLEPQEILALYASPAQVEKGETVMVGNIQSRNQNIFLVVETTCPLSTNTRPPSSHSLRQQPPIIEEEDEDDMEDGSAIYDAENPHDASAIPDWLKNEIDDAGEPHVPDVRQHQQVQKKHKSSTSSQEYERKLQQDFDKKQIEIRMEAQAAVRERERALNDEVLRLREELERQRSEQRQRLNNHGGGRDGDGGEKQEKGNSCGIM